MHPISAPLLPGQTGPQVVNLIECLLFLIGKGALKTYDAPDTPTREVVEALAAQARKEQAAETYGDAAQALVRYVQLQLGMGDVLNGTVDSDTAYKLNALLEKHGAWPAPAEVYQVFGRVTDRNTGKALSGLLVRAFDQDGLRSTPLGETRSDAEGAYNIPFTAADFQNTPAERGGPDLLLRAYDENGAEIGKSPLVNNAGLSTELNLTATPGLWVVKGTVRQGEEPVVGATVLVFDRDLRKRQLLGTDVTDEKGGYSITYQTAGFQRADRKQRPSPWLIVEVKTAGGSSVSKEKQQEVTRTETIDLELQSTAPRISEWERISAAVLPLLEGQGEGESDLSPEAMGPADIDFLEKETGGEATILGAWVNARQMQQEALCLLPADAQHGDMVALNAHGWPFFFGWQRAGLLSNLAGVLQADSVQWLMSLRISQARGWISPCSEGEASALQAALERLSAIARLDPVYAGDPLFAAIGALPTGLPPSIAVKALTIYREKGLNGLADFSELSSADPALESGLAVMATALRVYDVADGDTGLVQPIMLRLDGPAVGIERLASLTASDWTKLVIDAGVQEDRAQDKAAVLQLKVEQQHPAKALQARIASNEVVFEGYDQRELADLLQSNIKSVDNLLHGGDLDPADPFSTDHPQLSAQIVNLGRWVKAGAGLTWGQDLLGKGFTPGTITTYGGTVIETILPGLPPAIQKIIAGYKDRFSRDLERVLHEGYGGINRPPIGIQPGPSPLPQFDPLPPPVPGISGPTIRGMFGDLDECACRPCESVLGQSAYLVDLLNLLQREVLLPGAPGPGIQTGIDLLRSRRPDILDLELSCENAEVLLPHIDLALEALEWHATAGDLGYDGSSTPRPTTADWFTPTLDSNLQALLQRTSAETLDVLQANQDPSIKRLWHVTDGRRLWRIDALPINGSPQNSTKFRIVGVSVLRTSALPDPRIEPEHRNVAAYAILRGAVYPWGLPFDLDHAESRQYLERLKLSPRALLELTPTPAGAAWVNEMLGLTASERALLEARRTGDLLWQVWGFANAGQVTLPDPESAEQLTQQTPRQLLQRASILLSRSGLTSAQLEAALASRFVGGYGLSERHQCKTSLMRVVPELSADALDRLHRFVRLWRKLPSWSMELLDSVLEALNAAPAPATRVLDGDILSGIAYLLDSQRLLDISIDKLLGLQAPLSSVLLDRDAGGQVRTLFASVYLSSRSNALAKTMFSSVAAPGAVISDKIADNLDVLSAALGEKRATIAVLARYMPSTLGDSISHSTLTWLYRRVSLAQTLGLKAPELILFMSLAGAEPFAAELPPTGASATARLAGFIALATFARRAKKLAESQFSVAVAADALLPASDPVRQWLLRPEKIKSDDQVNAEISALRALLRKQQSAADVSEETKAKQVLLALSTAMPTDQAQQIVDTLGNPQLPADQRLVMALSGIANANDDPFGQPLLTPTESEDLLTTASAGLTRAQRLDRVLDAVGAKARRAVLADTLASWTGVKGDALARLLTESLMMDPASVGAAQRPPASVLLDAAFWNVDETAAIEPAVVEWGKRLCRLVALLEGPEIALSLGYLNQSAWGSVILPASAGGGTTPWQVLEPMLDLRWISDPSQISSDTLRAHLAAITEPGAASALQPAVLPLARRLETEPAALLGLAAHTFGVVADVPSLRDPKKLRRLVELAHLARPIRATAEQLADLAGSDMSRVARTARQLLAARLGDRAWTEALMIVSDALRKQQRDALVAHLIHKLAVADADSLYESLLIDPQIQPCFMTTRITQAISSVQLLVQRMLFGLEPDVVVSHTLRERWGWMRSYRLWEANRKVFLYPENWLFPELRDDKSPAFRRLEATLGEGELSQERAGQAFGQFLEEINQVAQTEVLGLFEDVETVNTDSGQQRTRRDLVLVGRSPNPPYRYHWRHCHDFGKKWMEWSPWERIELDIQGDHVMPFVANGRVHIAWPVVHKQKDELSEAVEQWRIELAWSAFDGMAWRQVSSSRDNAPFLYRTAFEDERSGLAFRPYVPAGSQPIIYAYLKGTATGSAVDMDPEPPVDDVAITDKIPPGLLETSGVEELARLLEATVNEFKESAPDLFDVMQLYCAVWKNSQTLLGYNWPEPLPKNKIFFDAEVMKYHRQERDGLAKNFVKAVTFPEQSLRDFIKDYRAFSGYDSAVYRYMGLSTTHPYSALVRAILTNCSSRTLWFKAWVRVSSNAKDLLELTPADGAFHLQVTGQAQPLVLNPGDPSEPMIKDGDMAGGTGHTVTLSWKPLGKSTPLTASRLLEPVAKGRSVTQTLHFEISDPSNQSGFVSRLLPPRPFKNVQKFTLQASGTMTTETVSNGLSLEPLDAGTTEVWMNGFKESQTQPQSFGLTLHKVWNSSIPVFGSSRSNQRYRVVGASAAGASALNQTNLWYFNELAAACLIDVSPEPATDASRSDISIFPIAWPQGDSISKMWSESGRLPSGRAQRDDFGANLLPTLADGMRTGLPSGVTQGEWLFDNRLPNAGYNWEIYFHAPLLIADQLSKQQRFEDAERWLRMVFDPNGVQQGLPQSFLRFRVFQEMPRGQSVASDLKSLAKAVGTTPSPHIESISALIARWRSRPFRPFLIARRRHVAFLWRTVFAYLDNLLAWADSLYRRDTRETVAEAAQLYILAARILGPKPRVSTARRVQKASSYTDLTQKWDEFANAWFDATGPAVSQPPPPPVGGVSATDHSPAPEGFLFFCIPVNEKLNSYWNLVSERLFNIRHCRNLEGIARDLPLTDPPIDPELLVRATAAGLSIDDVLNNLFARPLPYRYSVLAARALDLAGDVRAFGSALLSALEKKDSEELAQLRSKNELDLLNRVSAVRALQIEEAERNLEALRVSRAGAAARYEQIQRQLGATDKKAPKEHEIVGEESPLGRLSSGSTLATSNWGLIAEEQRQMDEQSIAGFWADADSVTRVVGGAFSLSASIAYAIPGNDQTGKVLSALASAGSATAESFRAISQIHQTLASRQATSASHIRRRDEWAYQANQVLRELRQIDKQILANEIRVALTRAELANHKAQIEQSEAVDTYLREKFSNVELYDWMASQLSALHGTAYRMALDMAMRAQRAAAHELELDVSPLDIIASDYWSGRRSSLLAGDRLHQDLKRLEIAYLDRNRRELELTKHISLNQLNPFALHQLREDGTCDFVIPEELFDLDFPGHYFRRIKSVSITIPCVAGPYTTINATLRLKKSRIRAKANLTDALVDNFVGIQSIATSSAQNDGGLFELNFQDERYLPFEYSGAISEWTLEMMEEKTLRQFDYHTIADVLVHLRYTAREDGGLKTSAVTRLQSLADALGGVPLLRLFSLRHDFPNEWYAWAKQDEALAIQLEKHHFPYFAQRKSLTISKAEAYEKGKTTDPTALTPAVDAKDGWTITGNLKKNLDDYFLIIYYTI